MKRTLVFLLLSLTLSNTVQAWTLRGAGTASCGDFVSARAKKGEGQYIDWVLGFISGVNYAANSYFGRDIGPVAYAVFLEKYCRENPEDRFSRASVALVKKLAR